MALGAWYSCLNIRRFLCREHARPPAAPKGQFIPFQDIIASPPPSLYPVKLVGAVGVVVFGAVVVVTFVDVLVAESDPFLLNATTATL